MEEHGLWARGLQYCRMCTQRCDSQAELHVESSRPRGPTQVPCIGKRILSHWTTRGVQALFDVRGSPVLSREEQPGCLLLLSWRFGVPCLGGLPFWVSGGARCPPTVLLLRSQSSRLSSYHILLSFGACCAVPSFYSCV